MPSAPWLASVASATGAPDDPFDLIIVGGGIIGAGVARDAALRGLKVLLLEKNDWGWGTTARSTRLVHGGLRYLEFLDLGLVREGLRERATLLRIAPHLVRPMPFLFPYYRGRGRGFLKLEAGLLLYDLLSKGNVGGEHRALSRDQIVGLEPVLDRPDLKGGFLFHDCQVDLPERLTLENVLDAQAHGAVCLNHEEVVGPLLEGERLVGVQSQHALDGTRSEHHGRLVLNAAGPWVGGLGEMLGAGAAAEPRRTKGIHILTRQVSRYALLVQAEGERIFFVIPWNGLSLVGTTDTEYVGDNDEVRATDEDVDYLLKQVNDNLDLSLSRGDVLYTMAGLRALVPARGRSANRTSRRQEVIVHSGERGPEGLVSVIGGKITAYRAIAEDVVDFVASRLDLRAVSTTQTEPLPGAQDHHGIEHELGRVGEDLEVTEAWLRRLAAIYGTRLRGIVKRLEDEPALGRELGSGHLLAVQLVVAVEEEGARTLEDVLLRRTGAGLGDDQGLPAAEPTAREMARLLGWNEDRVHREVQAYREAVARMGVPLGPAAPLSRPTGTPDEA